VEVLIRSALEAVVLASPDAEATLARMVEGFRATAQARRAAAPSSETSGATTS
jgi:hypothetical protein